MISDHIPDEITILAFRYLMDEHDLGKQIFQVDKADHKANGMAIQQGTIIVGILIPALSDTSTRTKPE